MEVTAMQGSSNLISITDIIQGGYIMQTEYIDITDLSIKYPLYIQPCKQYCNHLILLALPGNSDPCFIYRLAINRVYTVNNKGSFIKVSNYIKKNINK
jgi:hypothetical protein